MTNGPFQGHNKQSRKFPFNFWFVVGGIPFGCISKGGLLIIVGKDWVKKKKKKERKVIFSIVSLY